MTATTATTAMPVIPNQPTPGRPANQGPEALRSSAVALETAFLAEMLKSAGIGNQTGSGADAGDGIEQPLDSLLTDAYAEALMARGGIGLATHIERALALRNAEPAE